MINTSDLPQDYNTRHGQNSPPSHRTTELMLLQIKNNEDNQRLQTVARYDAIWMSLFYLVLSRNGEEFCNKLLSPDPDQLSEG